MPRWLQVGWCLSTGGTITDVWCFQSGGLVVTGTIVDFVGYYAAACSNIAGTAPVNASSIWCEKQTVGTSNNYGIVLDGDDLGADIAFGATQQLRMHHDGTNLTLEGAGIAVRA